MMKMLLAVGLVCLAAISVNGWVNDWDKPFNFECKPGYAISRIVSVHSNEHEDRKWDFSCRNVDATNSCFKSDWVNDWDGYLEFECQGKRALVGIESIHNNKDEDRRFKFKCCNVPSLINSRCYAMLNYLNVMNGYMYKKLQTNEVFKGMSGYHNNRYEDRVFKVKICRIKPSR